MLKAEPPSLRIIEQGKCGVVSSDFIRLKMAEAIPPDKGQLVSVGELGCPPLPKIEKKIFKRRKSKYHTTTSSSASALLLNNRCFVCC